MKASKADAWALGATGAPGGAPRGIRAAVALFRGADTVAGGSLSHFTVCVHCCCPSWVCGICRWSHTTNADRNRCGSNRRGSTPESAHEPSNASQFVRASATSRLTVQ